MDAMSDAIERADVMLYGVSLAYKESANVRRASSFVALYICIFYRGLAATHLFKQFMTHTIFNFSADWRPTTPTSKVWI